MRELRFQAYCFDQLLGSHHWMPSGKEIE